MCLGGSSSVLLSEQEIIPTVPPTFIGHFLFHNKHCRTHTVVCCTHFLRIRCVRVRMQHGSFILSVSYSAALLRIPALHTTDPTHGQELPFAIPFCFMFLRLCNHSPNLDPKFFWSKSRDLGTCLEGHISVPAYSRLQFKGPPVRRRSCIDCKRYLVV